MIAPMTLRRSSSRMLMVTHPQVAAVMAPPVMQEGNPRRHYYLAVTPWIRIMTTALRYLWRPQAECEARKIAPRRASIYT